MSLKNDGEQSLYVFDLKDGEPDFQGSLVLQVEVANGYPLLSHTVVDRDLYYLFGITLNDSHLGDARAKS